MPRGRPRKPRLSRMDAAIDAMLPLGFPAEKVVKTVKELLKEYGGDEAWPFIEEYSYKELLEAILRSVDEENEQNVEDCGTDKSFDDGAAGISYGVSNTKQEENVREDISMPTDVVLEPTHSVTVSNSPGIHNGTGENAYPSEGNAKSLKENAITKAQPKTHIVFPVSPSPTIRAPGYRRPCYGWIDSDEEEPDLINLTTGHAHYAALDKSKATPSHQFSKCAINGTRHKKKCRSRWDERPDGHY